MAQLYVDENFPIHTAETLREQAVMLLLPTNLAKPINRFLMR
jgi:hypothetical protein